VITVRTEDGKEQPYQIRPPVHDKLGNPRPGEKVILLIDDENHVIDIADPEAIKGYGTTTSGFSGTSSGSALKYCSRKCRVVFAATVRPTSLVGLGT